MAQINPGIRCPACDGEGEVQHRTCHHDRGCPCAVKYSVCSVCKGRGFIEADPSEGGAATGGCFAHGRRSGGRITAEDIGRAWS